jgi:hypothetical protein
LGVTHLRAYMARLLVRVVRILESQPVVRGAGRLLPHGGTAHSHLSARNKAAVESCTAGTAEVGGDSA